jgi:hypothetical protein
MRALCFYLNTNSARVPPLSLSLIKLPICSNNDFPPVFLRLKSDGLSSILLELSLAVSLAPLMMQSNVDGAGSVLRHVPSQVGFEDLGNTEIFLRTGLKLASTEPITARSIASQNVGMKWTTRCSWSTSDQITP